MDSDKSLHTETIVLFLSVRFSAVNNHYNVWLHPMYLDNIYMTLENVLSHDIKKETFSDKAMY